MRSQTAAFVLHMAVGFAVVILAFSVGLEGLRPLFLFLVGIPWLAGFVAFYGLPRTASVWLFPAVTLLIGLFLVARSRALEPWELGERGVYLGCVREPPFLLLREDQLLVGEHVVLAFGALFGRRLVSRFVQLGRETRGPHVVAVSDGAVLDQDARHDGNLPESAAASPTADWRV